jgi:hypothetical protein
MNDFYVGYLPHMPPGLRRFLTSCVGILLCLAALVAILLTYGQMPFANSRFAYLQYRDYDGVILESPHPLLLTSQGRYLLVAPGKHGANALVRGMNLRGVRLSGSLIERSGNRMLEVVPGSIHPAATGGTPHGSTQLGQVTVTGEIVDSKCYLGVMNPGSGKVHRGCAARCISGGIPPALLVRDSAGALQFLLLTTAQGQQLNRALLEFVAEPVQVTGQLSRVDDFLTLEIDLAAIQRRE